VLCQAGAIAPESPWLVFYSPGGRGSIAEKTYGHLHVSYINQYPMNGKCVMTVMICFIGYIYIYHIYYIQWDICNHS